MKTLFELSSEMLAIEATLEENGGELTPELMEKMEENTNALAKKVDGYFFLINKLESQADAAAKMAKHFSAKKKTADNAVKNLKSHLANCMEYFQIDKIEGEQCKASLRNTTALDVDEDTMLAPYMDRIKAFNEQLPAWLEITPKVSKTIIKEQFKGTDILPQGAQYKNNKSLLIR